MNSLFNLGQSGAWEIFRLGIGFEPDSRISRWWASNSGTQFALWASFFRFSPNPNSLSGSFLSCLSSLFLFDRYSVPMGGFVCLDVVGLAVLPKLEKNFCERVSDVSCLWMGYGGSSMVCLCGVPVQLLLVVGGRFFFFFFGLDYI